MSVENRELYRRWLLEMWNGRPDLAEELVTADFVIHQARTCGDASEAERGPGALKAMIAQGHTPFDELRFEIEIGPFVDGDYVAARWVGRGTYAGGIPGASAPAGKEVTFGGTDILRVESGRFAEYWVSSDGLSLMEQLGALGG